MPRPIYQLGLCEEILGHLDSAEAVLSRIPADSPFASQGCSGSCPAAMNTGRFAPAEALVEVRCSRDDGARSRAGPNQALQVLYHIEGRTAEIRELIEESWAQSATRRSCSRKLYVLDHSAFPVDHVRKTLENADPTDDRVWLGKANLAAWTGQFELASTLLDRAWSAGQTMNRSGSAARAVRVPPGILRPSSWRPVISRGPVHPWEVSSSEPGWPHARRR